MYAYYLPRYVCIMDDHDGGVLFAQAAAAMISPDGKKANTACYKQDQPA